MNKRITEFASSKTSSLEGEPARYTDQKLSASSGATASARSVERKVFVSSSPDRTIHFTVDTQRERNRERNLKANKRYRVKTSTKIED